MIACPSFLESRRLTGINQLLSVVIQQHLDWENPFPQGLVARATPSSLTRGKAPAPAQGVCAKDAVDGPEILAALLPQANPAEILPVRLDVLAT
jgi:hypothetical protein